MSKDSVDFSGELNENRTCNTVAVAVCPWAGLWTGWKEARVHFAVNCASVGCPPLRQQIYTADNVERLLAENTRLAFNTPRHLEISGDTLRLTELFDWYKADFEEEAGSTREFIRQWADDEVAEAISQTSAIEYIDYDWSLNRPDNFPDLKK